MLLSGCHWHYGHLVQSSILLIGGVLPESPFILFPNFSVSATCAPACFLKYIMPTSKSHSLKNERTNQNLGTLAAICLLPQRLPHEWCRFSRRRAEKIQTFCATCQVFQIFFSSISMKSPWITHRRRGDCKVFQNKPRLHWVVDQLYHNLGRGVLFDKQMGHSVSNLQLFTRPIQKWFFWSWSC